MNVKLDRTVAGLWLCLLCLLALPGVVQGQFTFTTENGTITITGYTGPGGDLIIPTTIDGLPVTSIGDLAFYGSGLTSVSIPGSVIRIGNGAFTGCNSLTSVSLPESVTDIGNHAFSDCGSLTSVTIPNSVTNLGDYAFARCGITNVTVPGSVRYLGYVFQRCTNLTSVTIGDGVTSIGDHAFQNDDYAFESSNLRSVRIPGTVTNIGAQAFDHCYKLTNAPIPSGVVSIGNAAFSATALTSITIPDSVVSIGGSAFSSCASVTNITIGKGVLSIGDSAFANANFYLARIHFRGNAPVVVGVPPTTHVFWNDNNLTVYYLPGTTGWSNTFGGRPTARWLLPNPTILTFPPYFGVQTNQFGFRVSWATNRTTVVEACTNLASSNWMPLATNAMTSIPGWFCFSDPAWTNHPSRIYRVRSQ